MGTLPAYLAKLESFIDVVEDPSGSNRTSIGAAFGWNGVPWCCETVSEGLRQSGSQVLHEASVAMARQKARQGVNGMAWLPWDAPIEAGMAVLFDWTGTRGAGSPEHFHIETVIYPGDQQTYYSLGGNVENRVKKQWRDRTYVQGLIRFPFEPPAPALSIFRTATPRPAPAVQTFGGGGISLNGPVVAAIGAVWLLTDRGDVYAVGLPDLGAPSRNEHGESWVFPQRRGARLEPDPSGGYVVADSVGERYAYSLGANTLPGTLSQISFASGVLLNGPVVAALGSGWILTDRGSVYAFGLSDAGSPDRNQHGENWSFPDRRAGQAPGIRCALEPRVDGGYNVFSTVGERYGYPGR